MNETNFAPYNAFYNQTYVAFIVIMLHSEKFIVYRLNHMPPELLPLTVRSTGRYSLRRDSFPEPIIQKWFSEIFWCQSGSGIFHLKGKKYTLKAGEVFYLLPGEKHELVPLVEPWTYYWLTLDHMKSADWLEAFGFNVRPFVAGPVPIQEFEAITKCLQQGTAQDDRQAAQHAHAILIKATEKKYGDYYQKTPIWVIKCRSMIDSGYTDPNLNINELAKVLGVHRVTLFRSFKQAYRINPSAYLQNRRLHHAMELLKSGKLSVQELAHQSGIPDANYLTKLIRRKSGFTPKDFRDNYSKGRLTQS